jgi:hypothetical protein
MKPRLSILLIGLISNMCIADVIELNCLSKSKLSHYHVVIDTDKKTGLLNYEFMGQKTSYAVENGKFQNKVFFGIASFYDSQTGEDHDEPFMLEVDLNKYTLKENSFVYNCK